MLLQRDAASAFPPVLQSFEGLLLDWDESAVRLQPSDVPNLPSILQAIADDPKALQAKRLALAKVWTRLLWREAMPPDAAAALKQMPDAFDSLMESLYLRQRYGLTNSRESGAGPGRG